MLTVLLAISLTLAHVGTSVVPGVRCSSDADCAAARAECWHGSAGIHGGARCACAVGLSWDAGAGRCGVVRNATVVDRAHAAVGSEVPHIYYREHLLAANRTAPPATYPPVWMCDARSRYCWTSTPSVAIAVPDRFWEIRTRRFGPTSIPLDDVIWRCREGFAPRLLPDDLVSADSPRGAGSRALESLCTPLAESCGVHGTYDAGAARCVCAAGWGGATCEEPHAHLRVPPSFDPSPCTSASCEEHATCATHVGTGVRQCVCNEGFVRAPGNSSCVADAATVTTFGGVTPQGTGVAVTYSVTDARSAWWRVGSSRFFGFSPAHEPRGVVRAGAWEVWAACAGGAELIRGQCVESGCSAQRDGVECPRCPSGRTGASCELSAGECAVEECSSRGECGERLAAPDVRTNDLPRACACGEPPDHCAHPDAPCVVPDLLANGDVVVPTTHEWARAAGRPCACEEGVGGNACEIRAANCSAALCAEGRGVCSTSAVGTECVCASEPLVARPRFFGLHCELSADECAEQRCSGHGQCERQNQGCECAPGYVGVECATRACAHGRPARPDGTCDCGPHFSGDRCETWVCNRDSVMLEGGCLCQGLWSLDANGNCTVHACGVGGAPVPGAPWACACDEAFVEAQENPLCRVEGCGEHGLYDPFTGGCACDYGWRGALCDDEVATLSMRVLAVVVFIVLALPCTVLCVLLARTDRHRGFARARESESTWE